MSGAKAASRAAASVSSQAREPIPREAQEMIAYTGLAYVATVNSDLTPNLSPKGSLKILDETTLVFGDIASPGTIANLRARPYVEINVVDVFRRHGYRFRGAAEISEDRDLIEFVGAGLGESYPISSVVRVAVEETRPLISPIYWLFDAAEDDVIAKWEGLLGYYRSTSPGRSTGNTPRLAHTEECPVWPMYR